MTWSKQTQTPVNVSAWKVTTLEGEDKVQLGINSQFAVLSLEDAASLGGYLLQFAPEPVQREVGDGEPGVQTRP